MPITQIDLEAAENLLRELLGNSDAAEEYSKDPEGWLKGNGYDNVSPEAVQQCAVSYAGAGGAYASTAASAASAGVAGVAAVVDPVVYNHYYEIDNSVDNSITNNIVNHGNLDFDQTVQQGDGNVAVDGDVYDSQIQTGSGIQAGDDVDIDDSNVATGDDNQQAIDDSINVTGDHNMTGVNEEETDIDVDADLGLRGGLVRGPLNGETDEFDDPS
jgi:hypothetical protein